MSARSDGLIMEYCSYVASSFAAVREMDIERWSESRKEHFLVDRPFCVPVHFYNEYMGSVDKNDRMTFYRVKAKANKWAIRAVF